jgi:hypothetical protein
VYKIPLELPDVKNYQSKSKSRTEDGIVLELSETMKNDAVQSILSCMAIKGHL